MSAPKNKFDLDKRERNKSVVQRFITEAPPADNNNEESAPVSPPAEETKNPAVSAVPAEPEQSFNGGADAIAAQLERLESRFEQFENKVSGLDKLDKLDKLDTIPDIRTEPKYILFNAMEEAVREEVKATMNNVNICRCDKCYYDICALVLNNSQPQYVTSQEGVLFKKAAALLSLETLTKLSNEIFNAISKVKDNPSH